MGSIHQHRTEIILELLRAADGRPVSFADLSRAGVDQPAQSIYELDLAGYPSSISTEASGLPLSSTRPLITAHRVPDLGAG
jgi:hypothetical protein